MSYRRETPIPIVSTIVTGHFVENLDYNTWRPRGTEDYLLIYTLSGSGRFGYERNAFVTSPGEVTLLRPGARHDYRTAPAAGSWELLWAHFLPRPHWLDWLAWPEEAPGLSRLTLRETGEAREQTETALWNMYRRGMGALPQREQFAMNALEEALLWCDGVNPQRTVARLDPRVRQAMQYLLENVRRLVPVPEVAREVGLSVSRLSHLFREQTGQTPQQFVERERIVRAQQLLSLTGRTVAAVAEEVGFENPFYFTLRFKKHTGLSPREWRKSGG